MLKCHLSPALSPKGGEGGDAFCRLLTASYAFLKEEVLNCYMVKWLHWEEVGKVVRKPCGIRANWPALVRVRR